MDVSVCVCPENLATLGSGKYYAQLVGEGDPDPSDLIVGGSEDPSSNGSGKIYEYVWTFGHLDDKVDGSNNTLWDTEFVGDLDVYVLFCGMTGWATTEPIASLKYMNPSPEMANGWLRKSSLSKNLKNLSSATALIPGGGSAAQWMNVAANVSAASIPQDGKLKWSVNKIATRLNDSRGIGEGVVWHIPKATVASLGGRLSGGVAVGFFGAKATHKATSTIARSTGNDKERGPFEEKSERAQQAGSSEIVMWADLAGRRRRVIRTDKRLIRVPQDPGSYLSLTLDIV